MAQAVGATSIFQFALLLGLAHHASYSSALSGCAVQELAHAAGRDGASCAELAALGAHGVHKQNILRDLVRYAKRAIDVRWDLYTVETLAPGRGGRKVVSLVSKPLLLPHEFLGWLWQHNTDRFHQVMGTRNLTDHWCHLLDACATDSPGMEWLTEHPAFEQIKADPAVWIPAKIFGDDGCIGEHRSLTVLHWLSSCSDERRTRFSRIPMMLLSGETSIPDVTEVPLLRAVA
eukprot:8082694-Alexandrium_andersonii.AAC.1